MVVCKKIAPKGSCTLRRGGLVAAEVSCWGKCHCRAGFEASCMLKPHPVSQTAF